MTVEREAQACADDIVTRINDLRYGPTARRLAAVSHLQDRAAGNEAAGKTDTATVSTAIADYLASYDGEPVEMKVPPDAMPLMEP